MSNQIKSTKDASLLIKGYYSRKYLFYFFERCVGISDEQKGKMLNVIVDKLHHPAPAIRRTSVKTVQELQFTSNEAIEGILSCLVEGSGDLQKDALNALENLLGKKVFFKNKSDSVLNSVELFFVRPFLFYPY